MRREFEGASNNLQFAFCNFQFAIPRLEGSSSAGDGAARDGRPYKGSSWFWGTAARTRVLVGFGGRPPVQGFYLVFGDGRPYKGSSWFWGTAARTRVLVGFGGRPPLQGF